MAGMFARNSFQSHEIILEDKKVVVEKAHIVGLEKTKSDYVVDALKPVLKCETFLQAYKTALICRDNLLARGIFQSVDIYLDTTEAYSRRVDNGIQVLFKVKERSFICGEAKTEMSNQDKPRWTMRIMCPNIMGRGETLATSFSHSFNSSCVTRIYQPTEFTTSFTKPFSNNSILQLAILKESQENPWSCCREITRGGQASYTIPILGNKHIFEYLAHWRELSCVSGKTPIDIRKQLGHSLKSSIRHSMIYDRNDQPILPRSGRYLKLTEELAGFGGNINFLKETMESSIHMPLTDKRLTLGLGLNCGFVIPLQGKSNEFFLNDKFFIGGPLTLRGFELNRVGNARLGSFLGSNCFWITGLHIYAPLPFHWSNFGNGSWLDNFRIHGFVNAGNVFDMNITKGVSRNFNAIYEKARLSYGVGVVYRFVNMARIELNFCVPHKAQHTDYACPGLQFGIGVSSV